MKKIKSRKKRNVLLYKINTCNKIQKVCINIYTCNTLLRKTSSSLFHSTNSLMPWNTCDDDLPHPQVLRRSGAINSPSFTYRSLEFLSSCGRMDPGSFRANVLARLLALGSILNLMDVVWRWLTRESEKAINQLLKLRSMCTGHCPLIKSSLESGFPLTLLTYNLIFSDIRHRSDCMYFNHLLPRKQAMLGL